MSSRVPIPPDHLIMVTSDARVFMSVIHEKDEQLAQCLSLLTCMCASCVAEAFHIVSTKLILNTHMRLFACSD